jgi:hypothetical protein
MTGVVPRRDSQSRNAAHVSLVGQQFLGRGQRLQQRHGGFAIEALAAAQEKAQRAAFAVYHRVDFGCAAAAACAQGLV